MKGEPGKGADPFGNAARSHFSEALARGFPPFLTAIAGSDPVNATPYVAQYGEFRRLAAEWPGRRDLLDALEWVRASSSACGVSVEALLVGGSFHDLANPAPRDVDCLMLYRRTAPDSPVDAVGLTALRKQAKRKSVDVRFVPVDADPVVLVKSLCYFTTLFCQAKPATGGRAAWTPRGLLLIDCRG